MAKILSERHPFTITEQQVAFVEGRQVLDASFMVNELIDEWKRKKQKGVVIKFDLEKVCSTRLIGLSSKTFLWQKALAQNGGGG